MGGEKKRVDVSMVEFDWIFAGETGRFFIETLSEAPSDSIFRVQTIKICLDFLWNFYFWRILVFVQIPFTVFFMLFLFYSSMEPAYEGSKYYTLMLCLRILFIGYCIFTVIMEIRQILIQGSKYFLSSSVMWNIIDLLSTILVLTSIGLDFAENEHVERSFGVRSMAVFFLWLKFFYFLRIFSATAAFIRMITEIFRDMAVFSLIYVIANLAFANAFFLLERGFSEKGDKIVGDNLYYVIIYTYMTGLGEFDTEFQDQENEGYYWAFFLICTILIQIVMLNLLIAIMGDTFARVQEAKSEAEMKERCKLMSENWFWMRQGRVFANTKYIAVAKLEAADESLMTV